MRPLSYAVDLLQARGKQSPHASSPVDSQPMVRVCDLCFFGVSVEPSNSMPKSPIPVGSPVRYRAVSSSRREQFQKDVVEEFQ
jgi:hypothetical protein